jgi:hypothetical protein
MFQSSKQIAQSSINQLRKLHGMNEIDEKYRTFLGHSAADSGPYDETAMRLAGTFHLDLEAIRAGLQDLSSPTRPRTRENGLFYALKNKVLTQRNRYAYVIKVNIILLTYRNVTIEKYLL